jgi:hypothetical protein
MDRNRSHPFENPGRTNRRNNPKERQMKYVIYDTGHAFLILEAKTEILFEHFAECETKAAAEKLVDAMNRSEKK